MQHIVTAFLLCIMITMTGCSRPGVSDAFFIETKGNGQEDVQPTTIELRGIKLTAPAGYDVTLSTATAKQPVPPDRSATSWANDIGAGSDSGNAGAGGDIPGLNGSMWAGICLIIAGGILWLSKGKGIAAVIAPGPTGLLMRLAAVLPPGTGMLTMGCGAALLVLPWFLGTIQPVVLPIAIIVAALCAWWVYNVIKSRSLTASAVSEPPAHSNHN